MKNNTTTDMKISSMKRRLDMYEKEGNMELLVDIANLALVEYMHSTHPLKHFADSGVHITGKEEKHE